MKRWVVLSIMVLFCMPGSWAFAQDASLDALLEGVEEFVVVTASRQAEPLRETPVPVTVIDQEMIARSGAQNLKDVLTIFVPGITFSQDHNEINVAMRGIYTSSQQKILILQDGHRLNGRSYSEADPNFSMSLDKIKQIEVLRGPGSSLYGNVALTAVINIITWSGADLNGTRASIGAGNYGQRQASLLHGRAFDADHELVLWGTFYRSDGEKVDIAADDNYTAEPVAGEAILNGNKDKPSHDVGLKYRFGDLTVLFIDRHSHYIEPFSAGGVTGETYDYDDYRSLYDVKPGLGSSYRHLGVQYNGLFSDDLELMIHSYFDMSTVDALLVINPAVQAYGAPSWSDYDFGAITQLKRTYDQARWGSGNVLIGFQFDRMEVTDSQFPLGGGGDWVGFADTADNRVLELGGEASYSAFAQIKHRFTPQLIANVGLRYDIKDRYKGDHVSDWTPRLAFIYLPKEAYGLKVSFAQSFVDAPYWYRYNSLGSYRGGESLKPEHLSAFQVTPFMRILDGKLGLNVNVYYNDLKDFIWRNNNAAPDEPIYQNAGGLKSWGIENEISYHEAYWRLNTAINFQQADEATNYGVTDADIHNVPAVTANAVLSVSPWAGSGRQLWFDVVGRYIGSQKSPIHIVFRDGDGQTVREFDEPDNEVDAVFLVDVGIRWHDLMKTGLFIEGRVTNAFDEDYKQGGAVAHPYPQPGRWLFARLGYRF